MQTLESQQFAILQIKLIKSRDYLFLAPSSRCPSSFSSLYIYCMALYTITAITSTYELSSCETFGPKDILHTNTHTHTYTHNQVQVCVGIVLQYWLHCGLNASFSNKK